jgi:hypothetical protein
VDGLAVLFTLAGLAIGAGLVGIAYGLACLAWRLMEGDKR